jgi:hypothetical protein
MFQSHNKSLDPELYFLESILNFFNNIKVGLLYGFFVEAFKLGS